jgi:hypothetical protein
MSTKPECTNPILIVREIKVSLRQDVPIND